MSEGYNKKCIDHIVPSRWRTQCKKEEKSKNLIRRETYRVLEGLNVWRHVNIHSINATMDVIEYFSSLYKMSTFFAVTRKCPLEAKALNKTSKN
jgi:hypothetical protein